MADVPGSPDESHPGPSLPESWKVNGKAMPDLMGGFPGPYSPSSVSSLCLLPNSICPPQLGSSELSPDTMSWGEWATG